jgi:hypothetical protein
MRLCLQNLEKRFYAVDSFLPKLLYEQVWDPFIMTALKTKGLGYVFTDVILAICRFSLNVCKKENGVSNNYFRIATSKSSNGGLPSRGSFLIKTRPIFNTWSQSFTETRV